MSWHPDDSYYASALQREEAAEVLAPADVLDRLRAAVAAAGSQAAFADQAGVLKSRVSEALSGTRPPSPDILRALRITRAYVTETSR